MKKILESIKLRSIKADLRRKYASQLQWNYELDINTVEGWNERVRISHSNILIDKGIEPTEENLAIFQEDVNERVKELEKKYPSEPLPIEPAISLKNCTLESQRPMELNLVELSVEYGTLYRWPARMMALGRECWEHPGRIYQIAIFLLHWLKASGSGRLKVQRKKPCSHTATILKVRQE